jgi:hypothetical protein
MTERELSRRTGQARPSSSAGTAGSLPTQIGTLPTTSPARARLRGLRGVSHVSLPPHKGVWTEDPTQQPAGRYLQARVL